MISAEELQEFWTDAAGEGLQAPLDYSREAQSEVTPAGFLVERLRFRSAAGRSLEGWIAYQAGAFGDPGFLWIAPYGQESMMPNEYGTRAGFVSLSFNFHGNPAFHREKYIQSRGYFASGADSPDTWIFRSMFKDCIVAARILAELPETGDKKIGAMGMSQGGGMAIWLGAWCSLVGAVCADMPFLGNIEDTLGGSVYRYPLKELTDYAEQIPLGLERVVNTASYYDTTAQAAFCSVPTQVSLGLRDPASRPEQVRSIFEALSGEKALRVYDWGHDWHPDMVTNNVQWLEEHLK